MSDDTNPYLPPSSNLEPDSKRSEHHNQPENFRDPTKLTKTVSGLILAGIVLIVISWGFDLMELSLLKTHQEGVEITESFQNQLESSDVNQAIVGILALLLAIPQLICILMWIYRANSNVRQLGAQNMQFTPRWSVGYYFIPILNLWKPYHAMKEIYRCSQSVSRQPEKTGLLLLRVWWFLYIVSLIISGIMGRDIWKLFTSTQEPSIEQFININILSQISAPIGIACSITLFLIVKKIYRMQMAH